LKLTFKRQIGLYCWILSASLTFDNKITSQKFRRNNSSCPMCRAMNKSRRSDLIVSQNVIQNKQHYVNVARVSFGRKLSSTLLYRVLLKLSTGSVYCLFWIFVEHSQTIIMSSNMAMKCKHFCCSPFKAEFISNCTVRWWAWCLLSSSTTTISGWWMSFDFFRGFIK
jgi:hypothetical protein